MSAVFSDIIPLALTTSVQDLGDVTPANKVRTWHVRFANVGAENAFADLNVITPSAVSVPRAKNYPVPYQQAGSAPDIEDGKLVLKAGHKLQAKASASSVVMASAYYVEADVADFA